MQQIHEKQQHDFLLLVEALKQVLEENNEQEIAKALSFDKTEDVILHTDKDTQLYSIVAFLYNVAGINAAVQHRRVLENNDLAAVKGGWYDILQQQILQGASESELLHALQEVHIEPVLTAHPTEAKRATVLEHHREIYLQLVRLENSMYSLREREDIFRHVKRSLYKLWRTGEIFLEKPDVTAELRNVLHYFTDVFPEVIPVVDKKLLYAWEKLGYKRSTLYLQKAFPGISFGNWVGGDRDGHPLVTAEVTQNTLQQLRLHALIALRRRLKYLAKTLSFSISVNEVSESFRERMEQMFKQLQAANREVYFNNEHEAVRQFCSYMIALLPLNTARGHATDIAEHSAAYTHPKQIIADLQLLYTTLLECGAVTTANEEIFGTIRMVETFGFHAARLDIRQNSAYHDLALQQLMEAAGVDSTLFMTGDERQRLDILSAELKSIRPFSSYMQVLPEQAEAVTRVYRVISEHIRKHGPDGIGSFIVSMTRGASDLFAVYILMREAGLLVQTEHGIRALCPVVPLFETIEDLQAAPEILDTFLANSITQHTLQLLYPHQMPVVQVMIGYSDSNKDGGIFASQWALAKAQRSLSAVATRYNVKIQFFHGKGGSISRGAGPVHEFLRALPEGTLHGHIRLTEQGETIEQKYAHKMNAAYHLEMLLAGTLGATKKYSHPAEPVHPLQHTLDILAEQSKYAYRNLIEQEGFIAFFRQATPIDAIESSKIGSRPSRRTGAQSLSDLRAIPWVFSWSQARFTMTSWYGVGSALEYIAQNYPQDYQDLCNIVYNDKFLQYVLGNVYRGIAASDPVVFSMYADLVEDKSISEVFVQQFITEREKTIYYLQQIFAEHLPEGIQSDDSIRHSLLLPLHRRQIDLLKKWRNIKAQLNSEQSNDSEEILRSLLLTVNAISGALGFTG